MIHEHHFTVPYIKKDGRQGNAIQANCLDCDYRMPKDQFMKLAGF